MSDSNDDKEFPSLSEQGKNLANFTFEVVKDVVNITHNRDVYVKDDVKKERMDICKQCVYYHAKQNRCKHCGCFLEHKVKFAISVCPIEKW